MYVWKERDTRTLCATETKSKTTEKRKQASGGCSPAAVLLLLDLLSR